MALPPKKHLFGEQGESARRGELTKSMILSSGDKRANFNCKTQFYNWYKKTPPHPLMDTETTDLSRVTTLFRPFLAEKSLTHINQCVAR